MASLVSLRTALPPHPLPQARARTLAAVVFGDRPSLAVFDRSGVGQRWLPYPPDDYLAPRGFEERNARAFRAALELAETAAREALSAAGRQPEEIEHLFAVTTTHLATPSLDARLVARLGLRADVRRWPLFGLGCAGGAGALLRASAVEGPSLVVAVETSSLVFSHGALEAADLVGAALFGDGAAAAVVGPGPGPRIAAGRTVLFEDTDRLMGWGFGADGFRLRLTPEVTGFVAGRIGPVVDDFLRAQGLSRKDVRLWALHPGGRRILEAYESALGLGEGLRHARASLAAVGNVASASVLFVLAEAMAEARPGDRALVAALGPGFAAELALLEW